jgi:RHS repeat-associated protein
LDDLPVATFRKGAYEYIEPDHLGTPRAIVDPVRNIPVWRWDLTGAATSTSVFGEHAAITDPDADSTTYEFNLRFPGQYLDTETGLHYNYFRDYDPSVGRYVESDPIGQAAGPSTYQYVWSNPLVLIDPLGLKRECKLARKPQIEWIPGRGETYVGDYATVDCVNIPDPPKPRLECPREGCTSCVERCQRTRDLWGPLVDATVSGAGLAYGVSAGTAVTSSSWYTAPVACAVVGSFGFGWTFGSYIKCKLDCTLFDNPYPQPYIVTFPEQ